MNGAAQGLDRSEIARRIPHQASMCLLDAVTAWDDNHISCRTHSHRAADHPLRAHGRLGAACGIEYAAQAMAMHGALMAEKAAHGRTAAVPPRGGFLASVRNVHLLVEQLDTITGPLTIQAERMTGDANTVLYSFTVQGDSRILVSGRAVVVLDASVLGMPGVPVSGAA